MFLYALAVEFVHPASGEAVRVEAPLPPDLQAFLDRLERPDDIAVA
jgi:23S rRNA pseudouridine955/2504/2580 synthase